MPFDIQSARKAGKTDSQIASYLGNVYGFDVEAARGAGKTDSQIAEYLSVNDRPSGITSTQVRSEDIMKEERGKMSSAEKFLVGVGAGMYELYKGIQQKGAQVGEKAGLVSPETVSRITSEGEETRKIIDPLTQESGAAKFGKVVGETAPTMAIPGGVSGGALKRAATSALSGAVLGGARFTGEGESTAKNMALGALAGGGTSAVLSGAGKVVNTLGGKTVRTATQRLAESKGIPTTLGEDTGNIITQKVETLLEKVPITGIRKFREKQLAAADDAAKDFLKKYIADPANATIEGNRSFSSSLFNSMKESVKEVKDLPIYAVKTADKARELLDTFPDIFKKFQNVKREEIIKDILTTPKTRNIVNPAIKTKGGFTFGTNIKGRVQPKSFDDMWTLRDGLGEMIGQAKKKLASGDVDRTAISQLNALYKAVNDDIDNWAGSVGKPELRTAINSANDAYKRYMVKHSILQKAYDNAVGKTSAKEMFSPKTFSTSLKKIIAKDKEYKSFSNAEIEEMTGLANIMQVVKRAGQYAENPPTGNRVIDAALTGGGVVGAATSLATTAKTTGVVAATSTIAKLLTTTKAGKSLVLAASKVEPASPQMQKIFNKIYQLAPRAVGSMAQNEFSPSMPDLVSSAEASELIDYRRGGVNSRLQAIREAAGDDEGPRAIKASTRQEENPQAVSTQELNERLDRLVIDTESRKQSNAVPKKRAYVPVKQIVVQTADGEELKYQDARGRIYDEDPNE